MSISSTVPSGCKCSTPSSPSLSVWLSPLPLASSSVFICSLSPWSLILSSWYLPHFLLYFKKPPSYSFICSVDLSMFPAAAISSFVSFTLSLFQNNLLKICQQWVLRYIENHRMIWKLENNKNRYPISCPFSKILASLRNFRIILDSGCYWLQNNFNFGQGDLFSSGDFSKIRDPV